MKRKAIPIALLTVGVVLVWLSLILTFASVSNANIIGGADWPTFILFFIYEKNGLYCLLALFGILFLFASQIVARKQKT